MQHYDSLESLSIPASSVTIGTFDGIHLGHYRVIRSAVSESTSRHIPSIVITFHPHPAVALGKMDHPQSLLDFEEKEQLIANLGVDYLITLPFTKTLASTSAEAFVTQLISHLGLRVLVTGEDFSLGKDRAGNQQALKQLSKDLNFELIQIPEVDAEGKRISSTDIRELIRQGNIYHANHLLGRAYQFNGKVIDGEHRGRKIGFPTANILPGADRLVPRLGVYATLLNWHHNLYPAVTNIGYRPTFNSDETLLTIETFVLDFRETLYGESIQLFFMDFIRPEIKFPDAALLRQQIQQDIQSAREILSHANRKKNLLTGSPDPLP